MPNSVTYLKWTTIFEWCVVRCRSKNRHKKTRVRKRLDYVLNNQHNWGDLYDCSLRKRIFTLIMNDMHMSSEKYEKNWLWVRCRFANHLALIVCFISYKWVQSEKCLNKAHYLIFLPSGLICNNFLHVKGERVAGNLTLNREGGQMWWSFLRDNPSKTDGCAMSLGPIAFTVSEEVPPSMFR